MKINNRLSTLLVAGAISLFATSCGDGTDGVKTDADSNAVGMQSSSDTAKDANDTKMDDPQLNDADFLTNASAANMAEIAALKSAQAHSTNAEVKSHAGMMLKDHQKMADDVMAYAKKKNITLAADANNGDKQKLADLEKKTGADYDKGWSEMMVDDHQKVIDMFEKENGKATDPELNTLVSSTLPTLRSHLDMSKQLDDKLKK